MTNVESKWKVLIGILLAAIFLGGETAAQIMGYKTYSVGYILGALSFLGAIVMGARRK
ncbi:hypothetical protein [Brevibacillus brevis]|uniref:Uncharacterized protein n=1 Tax=Brevibacillus brevis TaxID=1393 RepID=A0ABY9TAE9_BREBE|nr:hypothetical protein [Brevibacillus brevis]WNC16893.1 hypothetical protein RGB73_11420 [Brevibacillus brevis]